MSVEAAGRGGLRRAGIMIGYRGRGTTRGHIGTAPYRGLCVLTGRAAMTTRVRSVEPPNGSAATRGPDHATVGLFSLVGVVVGSMIGGGTFTLPQNMAQGAALDAVSTAWIITGLGMFFVSNSFRTLADQRPDLSAGIYPDGREGFGSFAGFQMAWGTG